MDTKNLEIQIIALKNSIDKLILIELCKLEVKRSQAREILGSLDNNTFSKINKLFNKQNENE